jgi:hypoxanthine phosphoribosyltransferase
VPRITLLSRPAGCHPDLEGVVASERTLARRVRELGAEIRRDYADQEVLLVGVLRAALIFLADLTRAITEPVCVDCLAAASYGASTVSSGEVRITRDLDEPVAGRHVVVVDTVLDTGLTLQALDATLRARDPASLHYCVLLEKERSVPPLFPADYVGFRVPDRWLVGYGCDYAQRFRNLRYVGVLRPAVYEGTT